MRPLRQRATVGATQARGDTNAFDQYFHENWASVVRYAARRGPRSTADDTAAQVFSIAWRNFDSNGSLPSLPWLYVTARNVMLNASRGDWRRQRLAERAEESIRDAARRAPWDPSEVIVALELAAAIRRKLTDLDAEIVFLTAWESLSSAEVGEAVGLSSEAVRQRLARARRMLRGQASIAPVADHEEIQ